MLTKRIMTWVVCYFLMTVNSFALNPLNAVLNCSNSQTFFHQDTATLQVPKKPFPQVFVIKNISNDQIILDHAHSTTGAKAGWSSYLSSQNWSAITISKPFALSCQRMQKNKVISENCSKVITICSPKQLQVPNNNGSYWLMEGVNDSQLYNWLIKNK